MVVGIKATLRKALIDRAESHSLLVSAHIEGGNVAHVERECSFGCPTARLVEIGHAQLVGPHNAVLGLCRVVTHTYHHHAHIAQRWVTNHCDAIVRLLGVVFSVTKVIRHALHTCHLVGVAILFHVGEDVEVAVDAVARRPHRLAVGIAVSAVFSFGSNLQWHFILIVIVFHIGSKAQEYRHIAIFQVGGIVDESLIVHVHLQTLVDAEVEAGVLIHCPCVAGTESCHLKCHRLLIELCHLRLTGIDDSRHARRQHVVHRCASGILLNVHGIDGERAFSRSIAALVEVVVVGAPLAADKLKCGKTQVGCLPETGHKHAYEANGGEIADASHHLVILLQGYLELIPHHRHLLSVAHALHDAALVGDMVLAHLEVFGAD